MKYCKYCGNKIEDNEVCTCPGAVNARQDVPTQRFSGKAEMRQASGQSNPYAEVMAGNRGENPFLKSLKNMPCIFTSYFTDMKKTIEIGRSTDDIIAGGLFAAVLFLALFISANCFFGAIFYNFGVVILSAFLMTIVAAAGYLLIALVPKLMLAKTGQPLKQLTDCVFSFGCHSIPASMIVIVGGLFFLFAPAIGIFFYIAAIVWMMVAAFSDLDADVSAPKNAIVFLMIKALFATIAAALVLLILVWMIRLDVSVAVNGGTGMIRYFM